MAHYENENAFVQIRGIVAANLYLKLEGLNSTGSIKLKAAREMVEQAERSGELRPDGVIVESSSGNLGCALASIAAARGMRFICVVDPNALAHSVKAMRALGAEIVCVTERDANGGFLGTRIARVQDELRRNPKAVWLNQYANRANADAHCKGTAQALLRAMPKIDYLFIGVGTSGTLMGCIRHFERASPSTRIIAVDSVGSISFGGASRPRHVPGLGASRVPELLDVGVVSHVVHVDEIDGIAMCRRIGRTEGILVGGSTGTVLAGVYASRCSISHGASVVALSPDMGERYLDTVYDDDWVSDRFGTGQLRHAEAALEQVWPSDEGQSRRFVTLDQRAVA